MQRAGRGGEVAPWPLRVAGTTFIKTGSVPSVTDMSFLESKGEGWKVCLATGAEKT